jgi:hypothetical protein
LSVTLKVGYKSTHRIKPNFFFLNTNLEILVSDYKQQIVILLFIL